MKKDTDSDFDTDPEGSRPQSNRQPALHQCGFTAAVSCWVSGAAAKLAPIQTVEKDHGRIEIRDYSQSDPMDGFADLDKGEGLKSVGVVESMRESKPLSDAMICRVCR